RLATKSAVTTCLKHKHNLRTVGDFESLAANLSNPDHRPTRDCTCRACEHMIAEERCANPHRCFDKAKAFLDTLPSKWDPRCEHPEDYEEKQMNELLTVGVTNGQIFDWTVTTYGSVGNIFRIFTDGRPTYQGVDGYTELTVATDGLCLNNGERCAHAGAGVFVGDNDPRNKSIRLPETLSQSNQTGEAVATYLASSTID
ncbi:hypothetical protein BC628DRAFT_1287317, partial [Trametes gibbosa]